MKRLLLAVMVLCLPALALANHPDRRYGGCTDDHTICAGPALAVGLLARDLKLDENRVGFMPGFGYAVTFFADQWHAAGAGFYLNLETNGPTGADVFTPSFIASFAEFARVGIGIERIKPRGADAETHLLVLIGLGIDIGAPLAP